MIELLIQNKETGQAFDVSNMVSGTIQWQQKLDLSASKFSFTLEQGTSAFVSEGSPVQFKVDNQGVFFGYVFKYALNEKKQIECTAYDQIRYLKYKDTYAFTNLSCEAIFKKICSEKELKYKIEHPCSYVLPQRFNDNKTLADMLQYSFDKTLIDTGQWMFLRDDFGTLKLLDIDKEKTDLVIGNESLLKSFSFESSIDGDTYNQIKLTQENKATAKRDTYIVKDSGTISKWGTLQYHEKADEGLNAAQIEQLATQYLERYNKPERKLKLPCIGDLRVRAGKGVYLLINGLDNVIKNNTYAIVTSVNHSFSNCMHMMDVEVKV